MTEPTTAEIRARHENIKSDNSWGWSYSAGRIANRDRGILLDRLEAAEAKLQTLKPVNISDNVWDAVTSRGIDLEAKLEAAEVSLQAISELRSRRISGCIALHGSGYANGHSYVDADDIQALLKDNP